MYLLQNTDKFIAITLLSISMYSSPLTKIEKVHFTCTRAHYLIERLVLISSVSERPHRVHIETVLLLAHRGNPGLDPRHVRFPIRLATILGQSLLLGGGLLFARQSVEWSRRAPGETGRKLFRLQLLRDPLELAAGRRH